MPQDGSNNYQYPPGTPGIPDTTIESEAYNTFLDDLVINDLNWPRPVHRGGTGANNADAALVNLHGVNKNGDTMVGHLALPTGPTDTNAVRKDYVDARVMDALAYGGMQVNGSFEVDQPNGGAAVTIPASVATHIMDSWKAIRTGTNAFNIQQAGSFVGGYHSALRLTVTTAQPSIGSDIVQLRHYIEGNRIVKLGWGTAAAQPLTVCFWVKSSVVGAYTVFAYNSDASAGVGANFTVATANFSQFVTVTFAAQTTGTWFTDTRTGIMLVFNLASSGGANIVSTVSNTFDITGVAVLPGIYAPTAAQSANLMRPYDQELATCQRYYEQLYIPSWQSGIAAGLSQIIPFTYKAYKRGLPTTVSISGPTYGSGASGAAINASNAWGISLAFISGGTGSYILNWLVAADARL